MLTKLQDDNARDLARLIQHDPRFEQSMKFFSDCHRVAKWQLRHGEVPDAASFFIAEMMAKISPLVADLVAAGDLKIASRLLPIVADYGRALDVYGPFVCADGLKRQSMEKILQKNSATKLLEMVSALHPKWDSMLGIKNRREIELLSEEKLRELLLTKVKIVNERKEQIVTGKRKRWQTTTKTEIRDYPLADLIENAIAIREAESARVNLFVHYLRQGWLWSLAGTKDKDGNFVSGSGCTFKKCPWHGRRNLPPLDLWRAWMKLMRPFFREVTDGDASRLSVFRFFLAARKAVYARSGEKGKETGRLVEDRPEFVWNQVENRISKAWKAMARREKRRFLKKTA